MIISVTHIELMFCIAMKLHKNRTQNLSHVLTSICPFTKSSSNNAMSIYSFLTQRSMIDFYLEFKLPPVHCYLKESQMVVRYVFVCSTLISFHYFSYSYNAKRGHPLNLFRKCPLSNTIFNFSD